MAIDVTCTGCRTRFQVSEKFAGKKGPCPKCKSIIQIPTLKEQVVIHAPQDTTTPKDSTGRPVFTPIARTEVKLTPLQIGGMIGAAVVVLVAALVLRVGASHPLPPIIPIFAAIVLAPPLAFAGYSFLRDDELEPFRGPELMARLAAPSVVYPVIWGLYWAVFAYLGVEPNVGYMLFVIPAAFALGTVTALASLDLEFGPASMHYCLYLAVTIILRLISGMNSLWDI